MPAWHGSAKERILSNRLLPGVENLLNSGKAALRSEGFGIDFFSELRLPEIGALLDEVLNPTELRRRCPRATSTLKTSLWQIPGLGRSS